MTREAVREGFADFVDELIDETYAEFDVGRAIHGGLQGGGSRVASALLKRSDALHRRVVRPELQAYRREILAQFDVVLDYAAAGPDADVEAYRDRLLARDMYADSIRDDVPADRVGEIRDRLVARQRRLGDACRPLVRSEVDDFWPAVRAELTVEAARSFVDDNFAFTDPVRAYPDAFAFSTGIDPSDVVGPLGLGLPTVSVDFTDEAVRTMQRAETVVQRRAHRRIDRQFDAD